MFWIVFVIFIGYLLIHICSRQTKNNGIIAKGKIIDETNTIVDQYGNEYLYPSGDQVLVRRDINHGNDLIMFDKHYRILRNISEERRQKEFARVSLTKERTAVLWDSRNNTDIDYDGKYHGLDNTYCCGRRYKDIKRGRLMVIRSFYYKPHEDILFYIDCKTGKIIRPTDGQEVKWLYGYSKKPDIEEIKRRAIELRDQYFPDDKFFNKNHYPGDNQDYMFYTFDGKRASKEFNKSIT